MKCNDVKNKMMDYLFNELSEAETSSYKTHLKECHECQNELQKFSSTVNIMNKWPEVEPKRDMVFITPKTSFIEKVKQSFHNDAYKTSVLRWTGRFAVAAIVLAVLIFRTNVHYSEGQFVLTIGANENAALSASANSPEVFIALKKLQDELYLTQQMLAESNKQNQELILTGLGQLSRKMDNQRVEDLRFVGTKLQNIENSHIYTMDQTKKSFQDLIKVISTENK